MAEAEGENTDAVQSKIPRYKTRIPVCSLEYKKVLRSVSDKKREIDELQNNIKSYKQNLTWRRANLEAHVSEPHGSDMFKRPSTPSTTRTKAAVDKNVRKVIFTPGGTKRKVKPCHLKFKADLKQALEHLVKKRTDSIMMVDKLVEKVQERFPDMQGFERAKILSTVSKIYGKKVEYMGKKKKAYYRGLSFIESPQDEDALEISTCSSTSQAGKPSKAKRSLLIDGCVTENKDMGGTDANDTTLGLLIDGCVTENKDMGGTDAKDTTLDSDDFMNLEELMMETADLEEAMTSNNDMQGIDNAKEMPEDLHLKSFLEYDNDVQKIMKMQEEVISLQQDIIGTGGLLGGLLTLSERNAIKTEVEKAKKLFNFGIRDNAKKDMSNVLSPLLFQKLVLDLKTTCPTITNILEQLVLSHNTSRNTLKNEEMKMKSAAHLLGCLLDIRDQRSKNDVPILFGLLSVCYGSGPAMIRVLQRLGLSESYPVLIGVLKNQLTNYRGIICQRVASTCPVITYQDNMQISRTSLRHLRLSKLQKEKIKQGKMWDFTVRGWREADTTGIQQYFNQRDAVNPQKAVKDLVYKDTKIESHDGINKKWTSFKERNVLRKMDLALNVVNLSATDIKSAASENLKKIADDAENQQKTGKKFLIDVPSVELDFPDLAGTKTKIFPLPISHENQCTTVGLAGNLDLFAEEFGFKNMKKTKYIQLKSSGKEFDLERAYERFAFMKSLEQHKIQQKQYEHFLRGGTEDVSDESVPVINDDEELLLVVDSDMSSDVDGED